VHHLLYRLALGVSILIVANTFTATAAPVCQNPITSGWGFDHVKEKAHSLAIDLWEQQAASAYGPSFGLWVKSNNNLPECRQDKSLRLWRCKVTAAPCDASASPDPTLATPGIALLGVKRIPQETNKWCWAAVGQMTLDYLKIQVRQCEEANALFKRNDCCDPPAKSSPNCVRGASQFWNTKMVSLTPSPHRATT